MSFEIRRKIVLSLPTFIVEPTLQATLVQTCSTTLRSMRSLTTPTSTTVHSERISKCCPKIHYGRCKLHSVSEHKKRYTRNYTQILENLRNAVFFFGLRNKFVNVQGNKKCNTQNIQVKKQQKEITIWIVLCGQTKKVSQSWLQCNGQGPLSQKVKIIGGITNMYQKVQ